MFTKFSRQQSANPLYQTSHAISHEEFIRFLRSRGLTQPVSVKSTKNPHLLAKTLLCLSLIFILIFSIYLLRNITQSNSHTDSQSLTNSRFSQNPALAVIKSNPAKFKPQSNLSVFYALLPQKSSTVAKKSTPTLAQSLQETIESWVTEANVNAGIEIYDLDNNLILATHNPDMSFEVASLYKLFYAYDGYTQIDANMINAAEIDNYRHCLNIIIRESDNLCAEKIMAKRSNVNRVLNLIAKLNLTHTTDAVLASSASDITELLKLYYTHPDLSTDSWNQLTDSMLNQTRPDLRQGLPNGFSTAKVYAKAGFDTKVYNEAAIIEFPAQNRHFSIVVLTTNLRSYNDLTTLGEHLENTFLNHI